MGGLLGGSIAVLIAARRHHGGSIPSYEYEAAGIHDGNLITTARRNLVREAYRDSFSGKTRYAETEDISKAHSRKRE